MHFYDILVSFSFENMEKPFGFEQDEVEPGGYLTIGILSMACGSEGGCCQFDDRLAEGNINQCFSGQAAATF